MGYITSQTVPSGTRYFILPVPDDLYMRVAVRDALEVLCETYSWEMAGAEGLTEEQQAGLFCAAFAALQELETLPTGGGMIGTVSWYATQALPAGVLLCNGQIYEASAYPELYAVIAESLKLPGDQFRVPNLIDRYARGTSAVAEIGVPLGSNEIYLEKHHIPDHTHNQLPTATYVQTIQKNGGNAKLGQGGTNKKFTRIDTGGIYDYVSQKPLDKSPATALLVPGIVANEQA